MRLFGAVAAFVLLIAGQSFPRVAPTSLQELTVRAKLIVIGQVATVRDVQGLKVAEVRITRTIKGAPQQVVYYLAQPTWICDTTGATVGEETLFFFEKYRFDPHPASMAYVKSAGAADSYTVENGATPAGAFKEPTGFREALTAIVGSSPFWQVSWSGRGQMPFRNVGNAKYVTLWISDVRLPTDMPTISGPQREYSSFIRSVPLPLMLNFIQQQVSTNARKSRVEHNRP